ncbi:MAG: bifunctional GrpB family protein/GNAT family N-acetyltransferase [Gemmatimonadota bacterium]
MPRTLRLVPYDPAWPDRFAAEAARLHASIGEHVIAIEHVGSTAVPGLAGKPVLDIGIAVADEAAADACIAPLAPLGFTHRGAHGPDPRRRYFVRDEGGVRVVQIHLYILPATAWDEQRLFRDALRADPALASAYAAEKYRVAEQVGWDKAEYSEAKGDFVQQVLATRRTAQPDHPAEVSVEAPLPRTRPAVRPPLRIETPRLILRAWTPEDASAAKAAIDRSLEHLRPWMPWANDEPSSLEALTARLLKFRGEFDAGEEWVYGIFAPDDRTVLGGTGLHARVGPEALEIGYWIDVTAVQRGYATEAAEALTTLALSWPEIAHVEIRCDPANVPSAAIPARLGYTHEETQLGVVVEGRPRDTMVWRRYASREAIDAG